jgi:hypothetical protein
MSGWMSSAGRGAWVRRRLGVGRLEAEAAGAIDGAQQDLQHMQRAAGLEPVGMGRDAAHRVHRHRPPIILSCLRPRHRPWAVEHDLLLEGHVRHLGGDAADLSAGIPVRSATAAGA